MLIIILCFSYRTNEMICIFRKQCLKNDKWSVKSQRHMEAGIYDKKLLNSPKESQFYSS